MLISAIICAAVAIAVILIILKIIGKSTKILKGVLVNSLVGVIVLWVLHLFIPTIVINWWSALITGFFGIPGVIIILFLQLGIGIK